MISFKVTWSVKKRSISLKDHVDNLIRSMRFDRWESFSLQRLGFLLVGRDCTPLTWSSNAWCNDCCASADSWELCTGKSIRSWQLKSKLDCEVLNAVGDGISSSVMSEQFIVRLSGLFAAAGNVSVSAFSCHISLLVLRLVSCSDSMLFGNR